VAEYERYAASGEINLSARLLRKHSRSRTNAVVEAFADRTQDIDRLDGVTITLGENTWFQCACLEYGTVAGV